MSRCNLCDLHKKCSNSLIVGKGKGRPQDTEIMIIQDAPTFFDSKVGQAPTGDTQKKLNYFIEKSKLNYNKLYFTSALKCGPKKLSDIKNKHIEACRTNYLFDEIIARKPKVIICMGKYAWQALTDHTSVREFAGHFDDFEMDYEIELANKSINKTFKCKVIPTYSLMASMKKWQYNSDIIRHFQKAVSYVQTGELPKIETTKVNTITTIEALNELVERYKTAKYVSSDLETTGFSFYKDKIINIGYSDREGHADVVFLNPYKKEHTKGWNARNIKRARQINEFLSKHKEEIHEAIRTINSYKHIKWILHNGKFDLKFARYHKIPYSGIYHDSLVASPLIDENLPHSLNFCLERNNINYGAYDTKLWKYVSKDKDKKSKKTYQFIPPLLIEKYLGIDVDGARRLYFVQVEQLKKENISEHFYKLKMPSLRDIIKSEYKGVKFDRKLILKSSRVVQKTQDKLLEKLFTITNNREFNPNSDKQVVNYMIDAGYPFKRLNVKENANGYSVASAELQKFLAFKKWSEFPQLILNTKKLAKIKGTYIDGKEGDGGMIQYLDDKNRVHANYNIWTPVTSRYSCFAKGTPIEIVRDHSERPIVPIEEVQVGDLAYCYDNNEKLTARRVKKVFNNGRKEIVRLHWASAGGRTGYVDMTEDHKVRTYEGLYIPANELVRGERLLFLSRKSGSKYQHINYKGGSESEHRFICRELNGEYPSDYHVHHKDHNHLNNLPDNLEAVHPFKHKSEHAREWSSKEEFKRRSSDQLKSQWEADPKFGRRYGENHPDYKGWSKYKLLKIILKSGCVMKNTGYDYYTIRKYLELHNIDYKKLRDRFTHTGRFITSAEIKDCLDGSIQNAKDKLEIGQNKWMRLKKEFTTDINHRFVCIERLGRYEEVYDLEIEEFHNYIAGEINVHNCNKPSLQVWPRPIKGLPNTRNFVIPTNKKWALFEADYSQLEQCVVAALSKDRVLIKKIQDGTDLHCFNATELGKILGSVPKWVSYEHMMIANGKAGDLKNVDEKIVQELLKEIESDKGKLINWKEKRTQAKGIGFGLNYGKGAKSFAEEFGITEAEAEDMIAAYFNIYKGMKAWRDSIIETALRKGEITLMSGRKRRFHAGADWLNHKYSKDIWSARAMREEISRQAMNYPVQGGAHEVFEPAVLRLNNRFRKEGSKARLMLLIHDGIVGECPRTETDSVKKWIKEEMVHTFHKGTELELTLNLDVDIYQREWYGAKVA